MNAAIKGPEEMSRVAALRELHILDTPIEDRFERITRLARRLLGVPIAAISLVDAARVWYKSIQGLDATEIPRGDSFCSHTIESDEMLVVTDASSDARFASNPLVTAAPGIGFYAGCPLHAADGQRIGALCIIDHKIRRLSRDDRQMLTDLASLVETELRDSAFKQVHLDLLAKLGGGQGAGLVDPLTRLWTREGIFELLDREVGRVAAGDASLGVVMADLDHFKDINERYGQPAGDEVLRQVARRMLGSLRQRDAIGRFDGEAFIAMFVDPDSQLSTMRIADRLHKRIGDGPIRVGELAMPVTASLGLVYLPAGAGATLDTIISRADAALQQAKRTGRDRTVCAEEPGLVTVAKAG